jgi:hypothetical protein
VDILHAPGTFHAALHLRSGALSRPATLPVPTIEPAALAACVVRQPVTFTDRTSSERSSSWTAPTGP